MSNLYCAMIHTGLELNFKSASISANHCCLRKTAFVIDNRTNFWTDSRFVSLREFNKKNIWAPGCENCQSLESAGEASFRTGMNQRFGTDKFDVRGPKRIDLMFDIGCNLACRTCGPNSSSFWQKHLKQNKIDFAPINYPHNFDTVISTLKNLDLQDLEMFVFCGGETLLGHSYWEIVSWLSQNLDCKKITLCFQTNGTQPINPKNYDQIEKFGLVKLHVSLDGVGKKFEYLRWPASWNQVVDNLMQIRETAPSNVMFLVEETVSVFNFYYLWELQNWTQINYKQNREGDIINHNKHLASGIFSLGNITKEYFTAMQDNQHQTLIPKTWNENKPLISKMIENIKQFDQIRNQDWKIIFPEVSEFYSRYI